MDEVGPSIFSNLYAALGADDEKISIIGAKKITFSRCEDTTKIYITKLFVYFV